MGTILQERQYVGRLSVWTEKPRIKTEASWSSSSRPDADSIQMGRRQFQRKLVQSPCTVAGQENNQNRKLQHRRRQKSRNSSDPQQGRTQVTPDSSSRQPSLPVDDRTSQNDRKAQQVPQRWHHMSTRGCRHTVFNSSPDLLGGQSDNPGKVAAGSDCETDLSDSERFSTAPRGRNPPQLDLEPEDFKEFSPRRAKHRSNRSGSEFPDFLPPPFNSWSLGQLAVFYNMEGSGAPRPRPVGTLERYLDKLLQLEWNQIQTVQDETGKSAVTSAPGCHKTAAAVSSRLSTPKCILQCQRAFPLSFLSSLANHTALLSGCACTQCRIRYTNTCGTPCCRSRQSRVSPLRQGGQFLPKRSHSESRAHSQGRPSSCRSPRPSSPVRSNNTHLKRMQASGNMRNQGSVIQSESTDSDPRIRTGRLDPERTHKTSELSRRSGSVQRARDADGKKEFSAKQRSKSECRRRGGFHREGVKIKSEDVKPDAVTAIMDNLPVSKYSLANRTNRPKQVEFVT